MKPGTAGLLYSPPTEPLPSQFRGNGPLVMTPGIRGIEAFFARSNGLSYRSEVGLQSYRTTDRQAHAN